MNRRIFIKNSSIIAISSAIPSCVNNNTNSYRRNKIGVSSYSFWHFDEDKKPTMGYCIEKAARMGFDGIEFLLVQMSSTENTHLQKLKKKAFHAGLDIMGLSTHQGFLNPSKEYRDENINKTIDQIEIAYQLGIPTMRINTGRWGTSESFDALMANKGIEPPIDGYDENDGFPWVIESIEKCIPTAEKCGVVLGLENHWGLGISAKNVKRIIDEINSPWLRATLDTGNFLEDRDNQIQTLAPYACLVQAKTYYGGGVWYSLDIDYNKIGKVMRDNNYKGYISLEFEGNEDPDTAIPKSLKLLRDNFYYNI